MEKLKKFITKKPESVNPDDIKKEASTEKAGYDIELNQLEAQKTELERKAKHAIKIGDLDEADALAEEVEQLYGAIESTRLARKRTRGIINRVEYKKRSMKTLESTKKLNAWEASLDLNPEDVKESIGELVKNEDKFREFDNAMNYALKLGGHEEKSDRKQAILAKLTAEVEAEKETEFMME